MTAEDWIARADQFWSAGALLAKQEYLGEQLFFPNVVCRAFAAEAYLKCLLALRGKSFPGDHNLRNLFRLLPPDDRAVIEDWWTAESLPGVLSRASFHPPGVTSPSSFKQALKRSALAFKEFRYVLGDTFHWSLAAFPEHVRRRILQVKPEWEACPPDAASTGLSTTQVPKIQAEVTSAPPPSGTR